MTPPVDPADPDTGLLAPGWAGSPAATATGDPAYLRALLDAEAALTRAQAAGAPVHELSPPLRKLLDTRL